MPRCRKEHQFNDWQPMKHNYKWYKEGGPRYLPMTEAELQATEKQWLDNDKKDKYGNYFFTKIVWERKCAKCGKEGFHYLDPNERPDNTEKAKVKKSGNTKVQKEKKHGRNLSAYKDEKMSKGSQPW